MICIKMRYEEYIYISRHKTSGDNFLNMLNYSNYNHIL